MPKAEIRPTQDLVREALFSILGERLHGARFLDLYAGTGAVGLEAWSRGAAAVCWVESGRQVVRMLKQNVGEMAPDAGRIVADEVERALRRGLPGGAFDIVYVDPPYRDVASRDAAGVPLPHRLIRLMDGVLAPGGLLVLEQGARDVADAPGGWSLLSTRNYGKTALQFLERKEDVETTS